MPSTTLQIALFAFLFMAAEASDPIGTWPDYPTWAIKEDFACPSQFDPTKCCFSAPRTPCIASNKCIYLGGSNSGCSGGSGKVDPSPAPELMNCSLPGSPFPADCARIKCTRPEQICGFMANGNAGCFKCKRPPPQPSATPSYD